jgi:hypothetical protein
VPLARLKSGSTKRGAPVLTDLSIATEHLASTVAAWASTVHPARGVVDGRVDSAIFAAAAAAGVRERGVCAQDSAVRSEGGQANKW